MEALIKYHKKYKVHREPFKSKHSASVNSLKNNSVNNLFETNPHFHLGMPYEEIDSLRVATKWYLSNRVKNINIIVMY